MRPSEYLRRFLSQYEDYVISTLKPKRDQLKAIFEPWKEPGYWKKYQDNIRRSIPSPVQRTKTRIKRPESVTDKIFRKPDLFPKGLDLDSVKIMEDALGGRIIVYFLSGLPIIDKEIRTHQSIEICEDVPPVAYLDQKLITRLGLGHLNRGEKESGYASIHYVIKLKDESESKEENPRIELQVRTLAEDIWGEVEHILGYKPNRYTSFAVKKQFQIISSQLATIDEHFNFLYEELSRFQEEVDIENDHLLNAENLPTVLQNLGISCAQREIDGLLKLLFSRGIKAVGDLRATASVKIIEIIRNSYRVHEGRDPIGFEIVANLAAIRGITDENELPNVIGAQIDFLKAWEKLKQEMQ